MVFILMVNELLVEMGDSEIESMLGIDIHDKLSRIIVSNRNQAFLRQMMNMDANRYLKRNNILDRD